MLAFTRPPILICNLFTYDIIRNNREMKPYSKLKNVDKNTLFSSARGTFEVTFQKKLQATFASIKT